MQNAFGKYVLQTGIHVLNHILLLFTNVNRAAESDKMSGIHFETTTYFHAFYENCDLP